MRIKIKFSKNIELVPNNLSVVNSYIHNCLGRNNEYHDLKFKDYSVSRLLGGTIIDGGRNIDYPNGGYILVTTNDMVFLNKIVMGMLQNSLGFGMDFLGVDYIQENFYNGYNYFKTTDCGFILKNADKPSGFATIEDDDIEQILTEHIIRKFKKIDPEFDFSNFKVEIQPHTSNRVHNIYSKGVKNISNVCQIKILTNKKLAEALYNYGIGQSCASGFGTIYTTQYLENYR